MRAERGRRPRCVTASLSRELDVMVVAGAENPGNAGEEKDAVAIPGSCQEWPISQGWWQQCAGGHGRATFHCSSLQAPPKP